MTTNGTKSGGTVFSHTPIRGYTKTDLTYNLANHEKWLTEEYVAYHRERARKEEAYEDLRDKRVLYIAELKAELQYRKDLKNAKARCTRLAKKIGAEVEQDHHDGTVWVYAPDDLYERDENGEAHDDPYFDNHYTEDLGLLGWLEAERRLKEYAAAQLPPTAKPNQKDPNP